MGILSILLLRTCPGRPPPPNAPVVLGHGRAGLGRHLRSERRDELLVVRDHDQLKIRLPRPVRDDPRKTMGQTSAIRFV